MTLPITSITFDCDLSAPYAQVARGFAPVVWPSVGHARRRMRVALNEACCAVICAQLRLLSLRISAEAETPVMGFRHA